MCVIGRPEGAERAFARPHLHFRESDGGHQGVRLCETERQRRGPGNTKRKGNRLRVRCTAELRQARAQARLLARFDSPISSQISSPDISQKKTKKRTRRGPPSRGPSSSLLHWQQSLVPPDSRIRVVFARLPPPRVHTRSPGSRAGFFFVSWHLEKKKWCFFLFFGVFLCFWFFLLLFAR